MSHRKSPTFGCTKLRKSQLQEIEPIHSIFVYSLCACPPVQPVFQCGYLFTLRNSRFFLASVLTYSCMVAVIFYTCNTDSRKLVSNDSNLEQLHSKIEKAQKTLNIKWTWFNAFWIISAFDCYMFWLQLQFSCSIKIFFEVNNTILPWKAWIVILKPQIFFLTSSKSFTMPVLTLGSFA